MSTNLFSRSALPAARWIVVSISVMMYGSDPAWGQPAHPIIIVHGLNSSSEVWEDDLVPFLDQHFTWRLGGTYNFDLGRTDTVADVTIDPALNPSPPTPGDLYMMNFEHAINDDSNDAAVYLQAKAVELVVQSVRAVTGADRVVLVGHSMGGLASAAYIAADREPDGAPDFYHGDVAKLLTLGTPFGGSNLSDWCGFLPGLETTANACRDLDVGSVFLAGGTEGDDDNGTDYWDDVNCNCASGEPSCLDDVVPGLAGWTWPADISYFWIVGDRDGSSGDCVVEAANQQLAFGERKRIDAAHATVNPCLDASCAETQALDAILEGLDEGDTPVKAWQARWGGTLEGLITYPGDTLGATGTEDVDYFRFTLFQPERVNVTFVNAGLNVDLLLCVASQACDPTIPGTFVRHDAVGAGASVAYETLLTSPIVPQDYFVAVRGFAPESPGGADDLGEEACDSNNVVIRDAYRLTVAPSSRSILDLTATPPASPVGDEITLSAEVTEADGVTPVGGVDVSFSPLFSGAYTGCVIVQGACTTQTDSAGVAQVGFASASAGTLTFVAEAVTGGLDAATVVFGDGQVVASATPNPLEIDHPSRIDVTVNDVLGVPVGAGVAVTFSSTFPGIFSGNGAGQTSPQTLPTDAGGETWIRFTGTAQGVASITIDVPEIGAGTVVPITFQNPSADITVGLTVGFVAGNESSSTYELEALVLDGSGDPIPGEPVTFTTTAGALPDDDCNTGPTGVCDVELTIDQSGSVTVTAEARAVVAATTFFAQVGTGGSSEMFPTEVLTMTDEVWALDFSPDGTTFAAADRNGKVQGWNTADWSTKWSPVDTADDKNVQLAFSPDNTKLLSTHSDGIDIFDASDGSLICEVAISPSNEKRLVGTFTSDTTHLATNDFTMFRYGSLCGSQSAPYTAGDNFEVTGHMDFSDDADLVAASTQGGTLLVFSPSGSFIRSEPITSGNDDGGDVAFNATGSKLLAVGWRAAKIFDTSGWSFFSLNPQNLDDDHWGAAFLDNDTKVAIGSRQKIEILDALTGASFRVGAVAGAAYEIAWNQDTEELAVGTTANRIYVFEPLFIDAYAPLISVTEPQDGSSTADPHPVTTGTVTDDSVITSFTIDGQQVALDPAGAFSHTLTLSPGPNQIVYEATDAPGNTAMVTIGVTLNVDQTPPVVSSPITLPPKGPPGTSFVISADVVDGDSGVASVTATVRDAGGGQVVVLPMGAVGGERYEASFDATGASLGFYTVDLEAVDASPQANTQIVPGATSFSVERCHALTVSHVGSGEDPEATPPSSAGCPSGRYFFGEPLALEASPSAGWEVQGWSGTQDDQSTATVNTAIMPDADHEVGVTYVATPTFTLTVTVLGAGSGTVTSSPPGIDCPANGCTLVLPPGAEVGLVADAATGSVFAGWGGACAGIGECTLLMSADRAVEATFLPDANLLDNPGCEVVADPWTCHIGCDLALVTTPVHAGSNACLVTQVTEVWQGPSQQVDPSRLVNGATYDASAWVRATVPAASAQLMLYLSDSTGQSRFVPLSTFQAVSDTAYAPVAGSATVSWNGTLLEARFYVQGSAGEAFYLDDAVLQTGAALHTLSVSVTGNGTGSVVSEPPGIDCGAACSAIYQPGTAVTLTPTADPGSLFAGWSGACTGTGACVVTVGENLSVTAALIDAPGPNLLLNPSCDTEVDPWTCHVGCSIEHVTSPTHGGTGACRVFELTQSWQGPAQQVATGSLVSGDQLCASAWIRGEAPFDAQLIAYLRDTTGREQFVPFSAFEPVTTDSFASISGCATLAWSGTLEELRFYIQGSTAPYVVDDLSLAPCSKAVGDRFGIQIGADPLQVAPPGVLGNDANPAAMTATLVRAPESGAVELSPDGSFIYRPGDGFRLVDRFLYQAHDGPTPSNPATVDVILGLLFADGFETGDTSAWSDTEP